MNELKLVDNNNKMKQIEIPIISQDLKQDEVCIRALRTFEYLDKVVDEVFDRIDARIAKNMTRIANVNERLEIASAKIESLKGSKKAIRIYSPAKFPIKNPPSFIPTFHEEFCTSPIDFNYNIQNVPFDSIDAKKYTDKLQFFHLKNAQQKTFSKPSLVFNTKYVNSLITFVNNENIIHNEANPKLQSYEQEILKSDEIDSEFSRFSTLMKTKHDNESFHYFPNMNQAPEIELPMDLPDLAGIVDDISFSFTLADQDLIVPSLTKMNIINELPNVDALIEAESNKRLQEIVTEKSKEINPVELKTPIMPQDISPAPAFIPPPPPPIPKSFIPIPPPVPTITSTDMKINKEEKHDKVESGDARSSLMQAIRNAAGKSKLRSVPAADDFPQIEKKKSQSVPAGDLMSDLHAKLALRRRGIAGNKEARKEKASLMDKVSSLIPPPPKRTDSDNESSDSDWE